MAAAGVGITAVPLHVVRGAVGEDCVVLRVDPSWRRELTVFSRVALTGAAAAFTELLRTTRSPVRAHADCVAGPPVVR